MPTIKVDFAADINTGADRVWDILADVKSWPEWLETSFVKPGEEGPMKKGYKFAAELGGVKWNLTVTKAARPLTICWTGKRFGITAVHNWEFSDEAGKTRAATWETMSGWVLLLLYPFIKNKLSRYDEKWLSGLKSRAESV